MAHTLLQSILDRTTASRRPLDAAEVAEVLRSAGPLELEGYRVFSDGRYGRNRVELREEFELVVICWKPGQSSDIHDHGQSLCGYLVVEGEMTEEVFQSEDGRTARATGDRRYGPGEIAIAEGRHLHRICNRSGSELVTVHLYTPPMGDTSQVYEEMGVEPIPHSESASQVSPEV